MQTSLPMREQTVEARTIRKVALRIVPFLMICYFVSFVDRVNLGFAALDMVKDLHLSPTVFGFGGGIFFLSVLPVRGAEQSGARAGRGSPLDCADHAHVGHCRRRDGARDRPDVAVCNAVPARCGRSGFFSRRHSLHHVLVSCRVPEPASSGGSRLRFPFPAFSVRRFPPRSSSGPTDGWAFADGSGCSFSRLCPRSCSASSASWC